MTDPHTYVDPQADIHNVASEGASGLVFLSSSEISLFLQLIRHRRSLPVYRAGCWACYDCPFESADLATTARHIMRVHEASPMNEEDLDEDSPYPGC